MTLILARCAADRSTAPSDTSTTTRGKVENSDDETEITEESTGENRERAGDEGEDESKGLGIISSDITGVRNGRSTGQGQGKGKGGSSEWVLALVLLVKSGESAQLRSRSLCVCVCVYVYVFVCVCVLLTIHPLVK